LTEKRLRVLIVEDEMLLAMNIEDMLLELGHEVAGVASQLEPALSLAREGDYDLALLDVNLSGSFSFPVASILRDRNIPFLFATGYGSKGINEEFRSCAVLQKPFCGVDLEQAINKIQRKYN
jgi:CheY-like chemotaxis protein